MSKGGKLFCDSHNPQLLAPMVVGAVTGANLQLIKTANKTSFNWQALPVPGFVRRFPVLMTDDRQCLFSTNAICRWLSSETEATSSNVDYWCEWEHDFLQVAVQNFSLSIAQKTKEDGPAKAFASVMKVLEAALAKHEHLGGSLQSVADLIVWSTLCPLLCPDSGSGIDINQYPAVKMWFLQLYSDASVKQGLEKVLAISSFQQLREYGLASADGVSAAEPLLKRGGQAKKKGNQKPEKKEEALTAASPPVVAATDVSKAELTAVIADWSGKAAGLPKPKPREHPILPKEGERNIMVTAALPYVNNVPHLGNIIGCVLSADVFSRFCRLFDCNVIYVCGTDEYGTATETKALQEGLTPQEICQKYYAVHCEVYEWFNISFDVFGRTTTSQQTEIAQDIFWRLHKRDLLTQDTVEQLFCENCQKFLADRFVEGTCPYPTCGYDDARGDQCDKCQLLINAVELKDPRCKVCSRRPIVRSSRHIFLDLSKLEGRVGEWFRKSAGTGEWSPTAKQITQTWIRDGLKARCITRDLKWGTPVPLEGFTDKVFYVWFDAPIGYLSMTANYTEHWEKWWKNPQQVQLYQFMAKDNVPFHCVIFPSCLIGSENNYTLVNHLSATEYLNYEDSKFSKSRGVGVFGDQAKHTCIPADVWRFYLLYIRPESQDSVFNWDDMFLKVNSELLNNLGNFINRALAFTKKSFGGVLPDVKLSEDDAKFVATVNREIKKYIQSLEGLKLRNGLRRVLAISQLGNGLIQANKPWVLVKGSAEDKTRGGSVINLAVQLVCQLAILLQPYMPEVAKEIQLQLQAKDDLFVLTDSFLPRLPSGHTIGEPSPLFKKLEMDLAAQYRKQYCGKS